MLGLIVAAALAAEEASPAAPPPAPAPAPAEAPARSSPISVVGDAAKSVGRALGQGVDQAGSALGKAGSALGKAGSAIGGAAGAVGRFVSPVVSPVVDTVSDKVVAPAVELVIPKEVKERQGDEVIDKTVVHGWRLKVDTEQFTGKAVCEAYHENLTYRNGVVKVQFSHAVATPDAVFRLDTGEPRAVSDYAIEVAGKGAPILSSNLGNPTDGAVFLPARVLTPAEMVWIKPSRQSMPQRFKVKGLKDALDALAERGCKAP